MKGFVASHLAVRCAHSYWEIHWVMGGGATVGELIKPNCEYMQGPGSGGDACGSPPRLPSAALSSFQCSSIPDGVTVAPPLWRCITYSRSPQGSSHLCWRSLSNLLSAFPGSPICLPFALSHSSFVFPSYRTPLLSGDACICRWRQPAPTSALVMANRSWAHALLRVSCK